MSDSFGKLTHTDIEWLDNDLSKDESTQEQAENILNFILLGSLNETNVDQFIRLLKNRGKEGLYAFDVYKGLIKKVSGNDFGNLEEGEISEYEQELKKMLVTDSYFIEYLEDKLAYDAQSQVNAFMEDIQIETEEILVDTTHKPYDENFLHKYYHFKTYADSSFNQILEALKSREKNRTIVKNNYHGLKDVSNNDIKSAVLAHQEDRVLQGLIDYIDKHLDPSSFYYFLKLLHTFLNDYYIELVSFASEKGFINSDQFHRGIPQPEELYFEQVTGKILDRFRGYLVATQNQLLLAIYPESKMDDVQYLSTTESITDHIQVAGDQTDIDDGEEEFDLQKVYQFSGELIDQLIEFTGNKQNKLNIDDVKKASERFIDQGNKAFHPTMENEDVFLMHCAQAEFDFINALQDTISTGMNESEYREFVEMLCEHHTYYYNILISGIDEKFEGVYSDIIMDDETAGSVGEEPLVEVDELQLQVLSEDSRVAEAFIFALDEDKRESLQVFISQIKFLELQDVLHNGSTMEQARTLRSFLGFYFSPKNCADVMKELVNTNPQFYKYFVFANANHEVDITETPTLTYQHLYDRLPDMLDFLTQHLTTEINELVFEDIDLPTDNTRGDFDDLQKVLADEQIEKSIHLSQLYDFLAYNLNPDNYLQVLQLIFIYNINLFLEYVIQKTDQKLEYRDSESDEFVVQKINPFTYDYSYDQISGDLLDDFLEILEGKIIKYSDEEIGFNHEHDTRYSDWVTNMMSLNLPDELSVENIGVLLEKISKEEITDYNENYIHSLKFQLALVLFKQVYTNETHLDCVVIMYHYFGLSIANGELISDDNLKPNELDDIGILTEEEKENLIHEITGEFKSYFDITVQYIKEDFIYMQKAREIDIH